MRKHRGVKIWVNPEFRKELKKQALDKGISLLELTERLSKRIKEENTNNEKKKPKFDFKL